MNSISFWIRIKGGEFYTVCKKQKGKKRKLVLKKIKRIAHLLCFYVLVAFIICPKKHNYIHYGCSVSPCFFLSVMCLYTAEGDPGLFVLYYLVFCICPICVQLCLSSRAPSPRSPWMMTSYSWPLTLTQTPPWAVPWYLYLYYTLTVIQRPHCPLLSKEMCLRRKTQSPFSLYHCLRRV